MSIIIETRGLTRRFGDNVAVDDVHLDVPENAIVGLLGRNGAGKTTLMALLTGQDFATAGTVKVFGENPVENDRVLAHTCFVRESQIYPNNFKVRHVLAAGPQFYPEWDVDLAERLVDAFGLPRKRQVQKLSRGMRAAMGVVIGLSAQAPLTILDEPVLGLDATARQLFYDELLKSYAENPRTFVLSTHLIDEAASLFEQVVVLDHGRVALAGETDELRASAAVLTGPRDAVGRMVAGQRVLHEEPLGGYTRVTVAVPPDQQLRDQAEALGVEVGPVSLQTLVVRTGLAESPTEGGQR